MAWISVEKGKSLFNEDHIVRIYKTNEDVSSTNMAQIVLLQDDGKEAIIRFERKRDRDFAWQKLIERIEVHYYDPIE